MTYLEATKESIHNYINGAIKAGELIPGDFKNVYALESFLSEMQYEICTADPEEARKMINAHPADVTRCISESMTEAGDVFDAYADGENMDVYFDRIARMFYFSEAVRDVFEEMHIRERIEDAHFVYNI